MRRPSYLEQGSMDAQAAPASVLQLSIFTSAKVQSIPRPERYTDFPVKVSLVAPGADQTVRAPIDVVAAIDVSRSVNDNQKLDREKAAMELVIEALVPGDRLSVVPFDDKVDKQVEELVVMSEQGKGETRSKVKSLTTRDGTRLSQPLERAEQILMARDDVDRAAFIILLSDGGDTNILKEKEWARTSTSILKSPEYPVHTFGFIGHNVETMDYIARRTKGTYRAIDGAGDESLRKFACEVAGLLTKATSRLFSAVGVGAELTAVHPGVSLLRIDSGERKASISSDARSGTVEIGAMNAGETTEFTVYLDVPEGDPDSEATEVLSIGGAYMQSWDRRRVELERSIVSVERPVPPPPPPPRCCAELDIIEYRLEYWCKVKRDLSSMYEKAEAEAVGGDCKCQCQVAAVLREASLESINRAMHHDICATVVQALKLRQCSTGDGADATEHGDDGDQAANNSTTVAA